MKVGEILKCIFIPFYAMKYTKEHKKSYGFDWYDFSIFHGVILSCYILLRLSLGIHDANISYECRIQSIADIIITPMYAIGCNLGKDRFDIRLN